MSHEEKGVMSEDWQGKLYQRRGQREGCTHHCIPEGLIRGLGFVLNVRRQPDLKKRLPAEREGRRGSEKLRGDCGTPAGNRVELRWYQKR